MVTHDMAEAVLLADRIVVLPGRIVADGAAAVGPGRWIRCPRPPEARGASRAPAQAFGRMNEPWPRWPFARPRLHVLLSASALVLGVAISLPLAVAASRSPRLRWPVLALASLIQTIPSLALLALFYPLLLALSALSHSLLGRGFSALGFLPSLLALTLYSVLPILRNAAAGILGVDPAVREAADGVGMTSRQKLFRSTAAGRAGDHGRRAHRGLDHRSRDAVDAGQPDQPRQLHLRRPADRELGLCAVRLRRRRRTRAGRRPVAGPRGGGRAPSQPAARAGRGRGPLVAGVAAADVAPFALNREAGGLCSGREELSEQYILAELMADRLEAVGAKAAARRTWARRSPTGAQAAGEIDACVDYSGTLWTNALGRKRDNPGRAEVLRQLTAELEDAATASSSPRLAGLRERLRLRRAARPAPRPCVASIADLARERRS
jgi:osmoprotectant transport system permease protein